MKTQKLVTPAIPQLLVELIDFFDYTVRIIQGIINTTKINLSHLTKENQMPES